MLDRHTFPYMEDRKIESVDTSCQVLNNVSQRKLPRKWKCKDTSNSSSSTTKRTEKKIKKKRSRSEDTSADDNIKIAYTLGFAAAQSINQSKECLKPSSPSRRVKKRMRVHHAETILSLLPTETRLRERIRELDKLPKYSKYVIQRRKMLTRALELVQSCNVKEKTPSQELLGLLSKLSL